MQETKQSAPIREERLDGQAALRFDMVASFWNTDVLVKRARALTCEPGIFPRKQAFSTIFPTLMWRCRRHLFSQGQTRILPSPLGDGDCTAAASLFAALKHRLRLVGWKRISFGHGGSASLPATSADASLDGFIGSQLIYSLPITSADASLEGKGFSWTRHSYSLPVTSAAPRWRGKDFLDEAHNLQKNIITNNI